jgi:Cu(I)/Ag(I) efflux system membrane fusion protein
MTSENPTSVTPRGTRRLGAGAVVAIAVASALVAGGGVYLLGHRHSGAPAAPQAAKTQYQCPMHPTIVQDHPGDCPICGMKLVAIQQPGAGAEKRSAKADSAKPQYQCPMHPTIVQDHPGDCPICGMKLVKMDEPAGQAKPSGERKILFYRSPMDPKQTSPTPRKDEMGMDYVPVYADEQGGGAPPVEGLATVNIDPSRQQLIGLKTAEVTRGKVGGAWRTVGRIAIDETRVRHINIKIPAYVERINVDFIGKPVKKGEPLFSLYSPELLSAQDEYLLAVKTQKSLAGTGGLPGDGDALVAAARRKLQLWDIPESEIERLDRTGKPTKTLTIYSPISGVVTKKDVVEGMKLDAGAMPYEIVDLAQVWVLADVYESELRHVKVGMPAMLTLNAYPNRVFKGRVQFIDPFLDPKTRTVKVRLAFPNPTGELKPEMFGEVVLQGATREGLRIPADAVIDSGTKNVVFVALGEGKFQPREVSLGDSDGQTVEVASGVSEGEQVVTRANFLVDSESRLRASLAGMANKQSAVPASTSTAKPDGAGADPHAGHGGH